LSAVLELDHPLLVIAGAGSGKTRVITYKVSYLIEKGFAPEEILLLTFTRKASKEMLDRVDMLLGGHFSAKVRGGTFHAFANFVLRKYHHMVDLPSNFNIIDMQDAADVVDLIKSELHLGGKKGGRAYPKKSRIIEIISKSRNIDCSTDDVIDNFFDSLDDFKGDINLLSKQYEKYKKVSGLLDYDDLLDKFRVSLRDNAKFRKSLQSKIRYILVDEFQDTNKAQNEIILHLTGNRNCITVVGDDTQSIYGFRGANFENILRFPAAFKDSRVVKIEQNYRSNTKILDLTNGIVENAVFGFKKKLISTKESTAKPIVKRLPDAESEASYIVDHMLRLHKNGVSFGEMAALTRASWHSNYIQTELTRRSIPYVVIGGIKFMERRHVKDILAFLKVAHNPLDAVSWHRILRLINGIGKMRAGELVRSLIHRAGKVDFSDFASRKFYTELQSLEFVVNAVMDLMDHPSAAVKKILDYYGPLLKALEDDYNKRVKDLEILADLATKYDSIEKFLTEFTLEPPSNKFQDSVTPLTDQAEEPPVTISTIHSAKGLEWYVVFIPFALDGLIPSSRSLGTIDELEEERRLFYVACSRPSELLYITMPSYIGSWDAFFTKPSRFLSQLDPDTFEVED
jgi:DNA helicase-2/ATP-dependent DNA helicase PcrA